MKIIKRDGRIVEYDKNKILIAINKANKEVQDKERISKEDIDSIIEYIESLNKKRMLVEDIQDIIEEKLMIMGKYLLAKKYIIYRYTRSLIRQNNTTDKSILTLLKNGNDINGDYVNAARQRDIMAGEASKDISRRILLPRNVVDADADKYIKFCNVEYFTEPVIDSCFLNLDKILEKGTYINGITIEKPKNFQSFCNVLIELILSISSCQTGDIYINFKDFFKYYYISLEKNIDLYFSLFKDTIEKEKIKAFAKNLTSIEVKSGLQTLIYQINTINNSYGLTSRVCIIINTNDIQCLEDENLINQFILELNKEIKTAEGSAFKYKYPKIFYVINDDNYSNESKYNYITEKLISSNNQVVFLNYLCLNKFMKLISEFNQGTIEIDIYKIIYSYIDSNYIDKIKEFLNICFEGFMCINHNLQGTLAKKSPIHWQYNVIANLKEDEKIDDYLKKEYSHLTLVIKNLEKVDTKYKNIDIEKVIDTIYKVVSNWNNISNFKVITSYKNIETLPVTNDFFDKYKLPFDLLFKLYNNEDNIINKKFNNILVIKP